MSDCLSHSCPTHLDCEVCSDEPCLVHQFCPREAVERAAKAIIEWEIDNGYLVSHVTEAEAMALAAIRAFHNEGD